MDHAIQYLSNKFQEIRDSPEHPVYHPEGTLGNHIMLVTLKAFLWTENADLIWAGLLHDIFKANKSFKSRVVTLPEGTYWSNPLHPKQAKEFIMENDDIKYLILQTGGNWKNVAELCYWHMAAKQGIPKKAGLVNGLSFFPPLDDMINRYKMPEKQFKSFFVPKHRDIKNFTLCDVKTGRAAFYLMGKEGLLRISYNDIPLFFEQSEKWKFLKDVFQS